MFTMRELNLRQRRWLEILKDYYMNVHFHKGKANVAADALSRTIIGSTTHVEDGKKGFGEIYTSTCKTGCTVSLLY